MIRRFLATLVIGVILGASVAGTVCQTTCATKDAAQANLNSSAQHHSCHSETPSARTVVAVAMHLCGHANELPAGRDEARQDLAAAAAVIPSMAFAAAVVEHTRSFDVAASSGPPVFVALTRPLRL